MLKIGPSEIKSRLLPDTGKFEGEVTQTKATETAEANVLIFVIRRMNLCDRNLPNPLANINPKNSTTSPSTISAKTVEGAIRIAEIAEHARVCDMVKVEVIGDDETLLPDPFETYEAYKVLLEKGYIVRPYIFNDVVLARRLEELGAHAIMPLASPIGTERGISNQFNLSYIIKHPNASVIVDAGIGSSKDACHAVELGTDAILSNTTVSGAKDPVKMAEAMRLGIHTGRLSYEAGHTPIKYAAQVSSPTKGLGFL